ncbi:MAG: hypothetical protein NZ749_13240 [bacterium]|nr:hypothetical protein [bacterium]
MRWLWRGCGLCLIALSVLALGGCGGGGGGGGGVITDTTPPLISGWQTRYEGDQLIVQAEVSDPDTGVQRVWVVRRGLNASQSEVEMQLLSGSTYRAVISEATARLQVRARDGAGNVAQTEETRVSPPPPPFTP